MRKPIMLGAAGAVIVVGAAFMFVLSPQMQETSDLRAETATQVQANDAKAAQVPVLTEKLANMSAGVDELRALSRQVPAQIGLDTLYQQVDAVAAQAGVVVTSKTVSSPVLVSAADPSAAGQAAATPGDSAAGQTDADGAAPAVVAPVLASYTLSMTVGATPETGQAFLTALEGMERLSVVHTTNWSVNEDGTGTLTVDATLYLQQVNVDDLAQQIETLAAGAKDAAKGAPMADATPSPQDSASPSAAPSPTDPASEAPTETPAAG